MVLDLGTMVQTSVLTGDERQIARRRRGRTLLDKMGAWAHNVQSLRGARAADAEPLVADEALARAGDDGSERGLAQYRDADGWTEVSSDDGDDGGEDEEDDEEDEDD